MLLHRSNDECHIFYIGAAWIWIHLETCNAHVNFCVCSELYASCQTSSVPIISITRSVYEFWDYVAEVCCEAKLIKTWWVVASGGWSSITRRVCVTRSANVTDCPCQGCSFILCCHVCNIKHKAWLAGSLKWKAIIQCTKTTSYIQTVLYKGTGCVFLEVKYCLLAYR
jgi:hypothetical protein